MKWSMDMLVDHIWVGHFGEYELPDEFMDVRFRKDGWPDMRFNRAKDILAWVAKVDREEAA